MDIPTHATLTTLPVELVLHIAEHFDNWWDTQNLMRAYLVSGTSNRITTRRFQKLMFRADARRLKSIVNSYDFPYRLGPLQLCKPPILASCWAILMGDVEVALSGMEEYRVQAHPNATGHLAFMTRGCCNEGYYCRADEISVNLSPSGPERNMVKTGHLTPLMLAVLSGNIDMLKAIIDWYLDNERHKQVGEPIILDEARKMRRMTRILYRHGYFKVTAIDLAAWQGRKDLVEVLVNKGAEVGWSHPDQGNREQKTSVLAALCDWGLDFCISEEQRSGRVAVLEFLLDQGYHIDQATHGDYTTFSRVGRFTEVIRDRVLPVPFTPLWHTIWVIKPEYLGLAQLLIRRGARWAPWADPATGPCKRKSMYNPHCIGNNTISPLEGVLVGSGYKERRKVKRESSWTAVAQSYETIITADTLVVNREKEMTADTVSNEEDLHSKVAKMADNLHQQPNDLEENLQAEEALFHMMMEEGTDQPNKPSQIRWVLETVLHGYSIRASNRHPLVIIHFVKMVNYLTERFATFRKLHKKSARRLAVLKRRARELVDARAASLAISDAAEIEVILKTGPGRGEIPQPTT